MPHTFADSVSVTYALIALNVAISLVGFWALGDERKQDWFLFVPHRVAQGKGLVGLVLSHFSHADFGHLLLNMIALYFFGPSVESGVGPLPFLLIYGVSGLVGTLFVFLRKRKDPRHSALGASGAIAGILFASVVVEPTASIFFMFVPVPIPAPVFAVIYLVLSSVLMGRGDHVAHEAHLGGAVAGFALVGVLYEPGYAPLMRAVEALVS